LRICIDAGHGGADSGAVSAGIREASVAWKIAHAAADRLRALGRLVVETRPEAGDGDALRRDLARRRDVASSCGLLVSVHCNASDSAASNGAEAYVAIGATPVSRLVAGMSVEACRAAGFRVRSHDGTALGAVRFESESQHPRLAILHLTRHAALVEVGFLTHAGDRERMTEHAEAIGTRLAEGIDAGLRRAEEYTVEVETPPAPKGGGVEPPESHV